MTDEQKARIVRLFGKDGLEYLETHQPPGMTELLDILTVAHKEFLVRADITVPCGVVKEGIGSSPLAQRLRLSATVAVDLTNAMLCTEVVGQPPSPRLAVCLFKIVRALKEYAPGLRR